MLKSAPCKCDTLQWRSETADNTPWVAELCQRWQPAPAPETPAAAGKQTQLRNPRKPEEQSWVRISVSTLRDEERRSSHVWVPGTCCYPWPTTERLG